MVRRILLVEGDATIRKHLATLLGTQGYGCCPVASLGAAFEEARRAAYPLIIIDLDLAGDDPRAIAAQFRSVAPVARLIALDSSASPADGLARDAFDAVVSKPFLADPLLAAIPSLLPLDA